MKGYSEFHFINKVHDGNCIMRIFLVVTPHILLIKTIWYENDYSATISKLQIAFSWYLLRVSM